MLQCEGDVYWTVHDHNALLPDPPAIAVDFDGLRVFEMTDLISFVRKRSNDDYTLIVARKDSLPESALPKCIRRLIPS